MENVKVVVAWVALGFIALIGLAIIWQIWSGRIDLTRLISEPSGDASLSRLQLLIFTFVIAASLFLIIASGTPPSFPRDDIPPGVPTLLGISASSYLVSKGIQFSKPEGIEDRPALVIVSPSSTTVHVGGTVEFSADVSRTQNKTVKWGIVPPGVGQIDASSGRYTAPANVPAGGVTVTVQAASVADATGVGTAVVTVVPA